MNEFKASSKDPIHRAMSPEAIRAEFPILQQTVYRQRDLIYLDNAASTQHPVSVIEAMNRCYRETFANVHRGIHFLSEKISAQFEAARKQVQIFINAQHNNEVIFTSGTTASINLVARSWGETNLRPGDEIILSIFEHHSNIVPWQQVAERTGAIIKFIPSTPEGEFDFEAFQTQLSSKTKLVSVAAVSNMLGTRVPVAKVVKLAKTVGAVTLIDAAQHTPHEPTDVQAWDADFVAFSGHKMLGPSGIGILWGKQAMLDAMPPFHGGGGMIDRVTTSGFTPGELPAKFEAGTPPIVEAIGLDAAIQYLNQFSLAEIGDQECELVRSAMDGMSSVAGLRIFGPPADRRAGMVSFVVDGVSSQDLATLLDRKGIAIRAGHHCTMPLHDTLGINASCRASFYLYNTLSEVEIFVRELELAVERLRN
jgi:cysteine desulfurase / selenocysteine lyase